MVVQKGLVVVVVQKGPVAVGVDGPSFLVEYVYQKQMGRLIGDFCFGLVLYRN